LAKTRLDFKPEDILKPELLSQLSDGWHLHREIGQICAR